jgi:hypothetical protein
MGISSFDPPVSQDSGTQFTSVGSLPVKKDETVDRSNAHHLLKEFDKIQSLIQPTLY